MRGPAKAKKTHGRTLVTPTLKPIMRTLTEIVTATLLMSMTMLLYRMLSHYRSLTYPLALRSDLTTSLICLIVPGANTALQPEGETVLIFVLPTLRRGLSHYWSLTIALSETIRIKNLPRFLLLVSILPRPYWQLFAHTKVLMNKSLHVWHPSLRILATAPLFTGAIKSHPIEQCSKKLSRIRDVKELSKTHTFIKWSQRHLRLAKGNPMARQKGRAKNKRRTQNLPVCP